MIGPYHSESCGCQVQYPYGKHEAPEGGGDFAIIECPYWLQNKGSFKMVDLLLEIRLDKAQKAQCNRAT